MIGVLSPDRGREFLSSQPRPGWFWGPRGKGVLSLGIKRPGREADHSPPSSVEVNIVWSYTSSHPTRLHGVVLS
jgi:hypothetical protein